MEALDYWRLCDELTITQAALLVCGVDPSECQDYVENWQASDRPVGYDAAKMAISTALKNGDIQGSLDTYKEEDEAWAAFTGRTKVDLVKSHVEVASLRKWLKKRGFNTGFFLEFHEETPDYLDVFHPRYSSKLAMAVNAWLAMEDSEKLAGKSPKQALDKWIREHAAQYGMTDSEGNPVNQAVEDCCKVANWNTTGGAPKTPAT